MPRPTGFPRPVIELVTARSQNYCECMSTGCTLIAEHIHHRRPKGLGGTRRPESQWASNALHVCLRCHLKIHAMPTWSRTHGFLVRQADDPATVPLYWRFSQTLLLNDTGSFTPTEMRTHG